MKFCLLGLNLFAYMLRFLVLTLRSRNALAAENLFLRKQIALYQEHRIKPRRTSHPVRLTLLWLSRRFDWRGVLTVVTPRTFIGWHRQGFQFYWRRKCEAGRSQIPLELQTLIRRMARENPLWGEERIANELLLKLGLRVSPRTVRKYPRPFRSGSMKFAASFARFSAEIRAQWQQRIYSPKVRLFLTLWFPFLLQKRRSNSVQICLKDKYRSSNLPISASTPGFLFHPGHEGYEKFGKQRGPQLPKRSHILTGDRSMAGRSSAALAVNSRTRCATIRLACLDKLNPANSKVSARERSTFSAT